MNDRERFERERERRRAQAALTKSHPISFKPEHMAAIQTLAKMSGMSESNALAIMLEASLTMARAAYYSDLMNAAFVQVPGEKGGARVAEAESSAEGQIERPDCSVCGHPAHARLQDEVPVPMMCRAPGCGCTAELEEQIPPSAGESMQPEPGEDPEAFRERLKALARGENEPKKGEPS